MKKTQIATFVKRFNDSVSGNSILAIGTAPIEVEVEEKELSAVVMENYGIDTVILTEHETIKDLVDDFQKSDDAKWLNGQGKKALYDLLMKNLKKENKYFNKKQQKQNTKNERWSNFCDDCVILAALGNVLYQKPIMLLHPKAYEKNIAKNTDAWLKGADGKLPSLINGIQILSTN
ncbi:hypothetical protein E6Q11_06650 [Candidatus Dojkabacteria bacterium]|uniref:Uncharacterized protein n=1 Tax=Candidatus Dojkabacteria bacterium TaxID=2099670 RepID=A0A5C7J2R2_9BACT|nr:MAG: hypothetical protein E6Q11_06650 [Candidatus Dojkabacteria bacterium]